MCVYILLEALMEPTVEEQAASLQPRCSEQEPECVCSVCVQSVCSVCVQCVCVCSVCVCVQCVCVQCVFMVSTRSRSGNHQIHNPPLQKDRQSRHRDDTVVREPLI